MLHPQLNGRVRIAVSTIALSFIPLLCEAQYGGLSSLHLAAYTEGRGGSLENPSREGPGSTDRPPPVSNDRQQPAPPNDRQQPAPPSSRPSEDTRHRNQPSGGIRFGANPAFTPGAPASDAGGDDLARNGPRLPLAYQTGIYVVQGYVRGGWPFVIDFLPQPDSRTSMDVTLDGRLAFTQLLDSDGSSGRRLVHVTLPAGLTESPRAGTYAIRSVHIQNGRRVQGADGKDVPADVQLYGIGAGPRAVGSVAIEEVTFEPGVLKMAPGAQASASYSYNAKSAFNRVAVEILKFVNRDGNVSAERVQSDEQVGVPLARSQRGIWNGTKQREALPSLGVHRLQVRAWFNSEDKSWVGAWSPGTVTVAP